MMAAACDVATPILNPVVHEITIITLSFTDDFSSDGLKKTTARHDSTVTSLAIDLDTQGAQFELTGPCGVKHGKVGVYPESVSGSFPPRDGGAEFYMTGVLDSTGAMVGDWNCKTRTQGPHYQSYSGKFMLRRRP